MFDLSAIPNHPNKTSETDLPFDFEVYAKDKYESTKKSYEVKYNETYLKEKLLEVEHVLKLERKYYEEWFTKLFGFFLKNIQEEKNVCICILQIEEFKKHNCLKSWEIELRNKCLKNFFYELMHKGYPYTIHEDLRDSNKECTLTIMINLK